ncbi:MAG: gamma-glutamylcyclotransferase [Clostridium sp.]|nr:gamma-glutamylcyclotransferase [Clostridium sp.]MCM1444303.1 gamma-glutamylcyclotransferase [Candidatus Amulumruptor caecigallinarius]
MFKKYYLAYGSNLNLTQMNYRCHNAKPIGTTNLEGYRLVYKGRENNFAYLTIEKCESYSVPLGVFEISSFDIYLLDIYEGYPNLYSKHYIPIKIDNKTKKALIYVINDYFEYHFPAKGYIDICTEGYRDFGFDQSILDKALVDTIDNISSIKEYKKTQS